MFAWCATALTYTVLSPFMERSHSGLVRLLGEQVGPQGPRGFESLPLRHKPERLCVEWIIKNLHMFFLNMGRSVYGEPRTGAKRLVLWPP